MVMSSHGRENDMRIGILGTGNIARILAMTIKKVKVLELYAVSSRNNFRAKAFARYFNIPKAYGSYEEMVRDENVELVYIATPHSHHFEHIKLCISHKKAVLCEKAFTSSFEEAEEIKRLAAKNKIYVAEAMWTRYMPSRHIIKDIISSEVIGKISMVTVNLSYDVDEVERIQRPELAGGALLDLGVYGLNFITMYCGKDIDKISVTATKTETGVDGKECIVVVFKNGIMAVSVHGIYGRSDRCGVFYGEKGYIVVENINNPSSINVFDDSDKLIKHIDVPKQISGYEYELLETVECIKNGLLESKSMPLDESVYIMKLISNIKSKF
jgi:predicted dehydrogenases and related proteins